jgi:hypothetical protein
LLAAPLVSASGPLPPEDPCVSTGIFNLLSWSYFGRSKSTRFKTGKPAPHPYPPKLLRCQQSQAHLLSAGQGSWANQRDWIGHFNKLETKLHLNFQAYPAFSWYSDMPAGHKTSPRVPRRLKAVRVLFAVRCPSKPPLIKGDREIRKWPTAVDLSA